MIDKHVRRQRDGYRLAIASDLRLLQRAVGAATGTVTNPDLIGQAADRLSVDKRVDFWRVDFAGSLIIVPEQPTHVIPGGAQVDTVSLSVSICGRYPNDGPVHDRLSEMEVNLELRGRDAAQQPLYFAWHFDRHIDGAKKSIFMHPRYHVQHAGNKMSNPAMSWGEAIFHDAPRLLHPPLDGVLALDLALANFAPNAWNALKGNPNYTVPVAQSITRLWEPYITALANGITTRSGDALDLWPCLC